MDFISILIAPISTKHLLVQKRNILRYRNARLIKTNYFHFKYMLIWRVFNGIHGKIIRDTVRVLNWRKLLKERI
jgi:hypothetical protein